MRSSISNSERRFGKCASRAEVFQTDSDPAPPTLDRGLERAVPILPWSRMLAVVATVSLACILAWEGTMRMIGLRAGDLGDGPDYWAVERRKADTGPSNAVVLIGDSRMLFDTDLARWQALTGRRPIQLALLGGNAQPILHDLAADPHFAGLVVVGTAEFSYFNDRAGSAGRALDYWQKETPAQRIDHVLYQAASRYLAFLDTDYTMFTLFERQDWPERDGVEGPYLDVWKLGEFHDDRQAYLWDRLEAEPYLRDHARRLWLEIFSGDPVTAAMVDHVIAQTKPDIDRIRARGGEVVWLRPPSAGPLLDLERRRFPRRETWDRLLRETGSFGVYFDDYPSMRQLPLPDYSHLSRSSASTFTDAYVGILLNQVDWLKRHERGESADKAVASQLPGGGN
jgi:hypothetical protein